MKKTLLFIAILFFTVGTTNAQSRRNKKKADTETAKWNYDIECIGEAKAGVYTLKVFSILRDESIARVQASKNAVHAVIFQGINAQGTKCTQKPALARSPNLETEFEEFFNVFFESKGKKDLNNFSKYVNVIDGVTDRIKVSKKEYRIGTLVTVNVALLRKTLENENIIKSLDSGF
ncbi:hypothetical protein FG167_11605 [Lacinutrix sp. WUR7]|uniref:hypothetical protein n=1 Tax=Lacinutrix TaxID=291183 RepID=UPI0006E40B9D|nr:MULTISPECIES: hypothetical protein [Lacinutrix]QRM89847.1 hypothetical protein FG167_11605 [Lacinutrix sp. WUR7]